MEDERRIVAVLILVAVAIVGFAVGRGSASDSSPEVSHEAANAATVVSYAPGSGWRVAPGAPTIPGVSISQPLVLAPGGDASKAGLIVGELTGGGPGPLPAQLLERLHEPPATDVVDLLNTQAYRYAQVKVAGSNRDITLFTIPGSTTATTVIVCYASAGDTSDLKACEHLAGTLAISTGMPRVEVRTSEPLTPSAGYGRRIREAVARVNTLLLTVRPTLRAGDTRAGAAKVAARLAAGLAGASESLAGLSPPTAAVGVHEAISASLARARAAYAALSAAAEEDNTAGYATARSQVYSAEAGLSRAVKDLTLLGYQ